MNDAMLALVVTCSILALVGFVMFIIKYCFYIDSKKGEQTISFKAFKSLYSISPSKWNTNEEGYLEYLYYDSYTSQGRKRIYMESFLDQLRYDHFARCLKKQKENDKYNKETEMLLKMWQEDIDRYRKNAQKEINDMIKNIK